MHVTRINCLAPECASELNVEFIKKTVPPELFARYEEIAFSTAVSQHPNAVYVESLFALCIVHCT
jgi:hypothetical protein